MFVAPVESDIPKRAEKNSADPAHARSTIRRRSRPLNPLSDRLRVVYEEQRRLRLLSGLRERDDSAQPPPVSGLPSSIGLLIDDDDDIFNGTLGPRLRRQQEQYQLERRQRELQQERRQLERRQQEHRQRERRLLDRSTQGRSEQENREARAGRPRAFFGTTLANAQEAPSPASPSIVSIPYSVILAVACKIPRLTVLIIVGWPCTYVYAASFHHPPRSSPWL